MARLILAFVVSVSAPACQEDPEPIGQLIVALDTDMALPDAIDEVTITVDVAGVRKFEYAYPVGDGANRFAVPATLTLVAGEDPAAAVRVRAIGRKSDHYRTFREIITTAPLRRTATLRMPLQWLCDGSAKVGAGTDDNGMRQVDSTCDEGFTCRAGTCQPNEDKEPELPDYTPQSVFGGAQLPEDGMCFDTLACMIKGRSAEADEQCTIARPLTGGFVNVALRVNNDGICDNTMTLCFVPLDHDAKEGWSETEDGERIQLPQAVCKKIAEGLISYVYVSTECTTKVPGMPPCGDWTKAKKANGPPGGGGQPVTRPMEVARLRPGESPCCPLMSDGGKLYTCSCETPTAATVLQLLLDSRMSNSITSLNPPATPRNERFLSAAAYDGMMYWPSGKLVQLTPLVTGRRASSWDAKGTLFGKASMLVDASGVYALASGVEDASGPAVKVIKLTAAGDRQVFETGGTEAVYQLDQDADAVYVVSSFDQASDGVAPSATAATIERKTSVVRLDKQTGERTTVLPELTLTIDANNRFQGGYSGLRVDADAGYLYALFEAPRAADGSVQAQIRKAAIHGPASEPETLWDFKFDSTHTQVRLQGAIDGAVFYSSIDSPDGTDGASGTNGSTASGATVVMLANDQSTPRPLLRLNGEAPVAGLGSDAMNIYWLTNAGLLYGFPRSELQR